MRGHKNNKLLSKEEIMELSTAEYHRIMEEFTPEEKVKFLDFHYKLRDVESWINEQMRRCENYAMRKLCN